MNYWKTISPSSAEKGYQAAVAMTEIQFLFPDKKEDTELVMDYAELGDIMEEIENVGLHRWNSEGELQALRVTRDTFWSGRPEHWSDWEACEEMPEVGLAPEMVVRVSAVGGGTVGRKYTSQVWFYLVTTTDDEEICWGELRTGTVAAGHAQAIMIAWAEALRLHDDLLMNGESRFWKPLV